MAKTFSGDKEMKTTFIKIRKNNGINYWLNWKYKGYGNSQAAREFLKKYSALGANITEKQSMELFNEF